MPDCGSLQKRLPSVRYRGACPLRRVARIPDARQVLRAVHPAGCAAWQSSPHEIAVGLALPDHLLAVGINGVVDDPFRGIHRVIVLVSEMTKSFGDGFEPGSFGLMIERVV